MPRTWSPSTMRPSPSTAISRSASPSSANPTSAPRCATSRASDAGEVAPDSTLMFTPSGSTWMASTRAPVAARIARPAAPPEPFAPSSTMCRPLASIEAGQRPAVLEVALDGVGGVDPAPERGVGDAAELGLVPDQVLELVLDGVVELEPVGIEHLEAVVVGRVVRRGDHDRRPGTGRSSRGRRGPASAPRRRRGRRCPGWSHRRRWPPRTCRRSGACPARPRSPHPARPGASPSRGRARTRSSVGGRRWRPRGCHRSRTGVPRR